MTMSVIGERSQRLCALQKRIKKQFTTEFNILKLKNLRLNNRKNFSLITTFK